MGRPVDVLIAVEPGMVADLLDRFLRRELSGVVLHRSIAAGHFDAAISVDALPPSVDADVIIVLPGNDDPRGKVQVHRGDGRVEVVPLDTDVLVTVLDVLREPARRSDQASAEQPSGRHPHS